jgi:hypothetical protein
VAGDIFNLYSQPQDPQMQINVMPWLAVAWGLLVGALLAKPRGVAVVLAVLSLAPLAWNVGQLARFRGGDAAALKATSALEQRFPPASTVWVYWGFEPITMWQYALWSRTWDWDGAVTVEPAPSAAPKFKWIAIDAGAIRHPDWTAEQNAETIKRDIDQAFDRGYRVVISDVWTWSLDELTGQLGGLSAAPPSTGCCMTTTMRSLSSANPWPARTTSCGDADIDDSPRHPYRRRGPRSPTGVQLFCKGEVR